MQGYGVNFRAPKVDIHQFSMIPKSDIPRSRFRMMHQHKTTISASFIYPVYLQEVIPGDAFNVSCQCFSRLATPLFPLFDQLDLEFFFFFVPNRLVWIHWPMFCGEQKNVGDSISYSIPQCVSPVNGFASLSLFDYFGLPCAGQIGAGNTISVSALPFRAYNLIMQEWFRDQNLVTSPPVGGVGGSAWFINMDDGPDSYLNYTLFTAAKRPDYFTTALPWTQKGGVSVALPLQGSATVKTQATELFTGAQQALSLRLTTGAAGSAQTLSTTSATPGLLFGGTTPAVGGTTGNWYPTNLYADLSTATQVTINAFRLAFQTQRFLEKNARAGTRYTEIIRQHFGVMSPDARLMRPEYLGGGKVPVNVVPVPQTTATGLTGGSSPLGTLAAAGTASGRVGFRGSFTEHGHIIGLVCARSEQLYQQGIRRLWKRSTLYDFYWPVFQALGEQSVFNYELYSDGSANDALTFGYQERWAEYRYHPSHTTGYFNSKNATPLDAWHLGVKFAALPLLNASFIADPLQTTLQRNLASGASSVGQQLLVDMLFDEQVARPMPMYSVPGMIDHF